MNEIYTVDANDVFISYDWKTTKEYANENLYEKKMQEFTNGIETFFNVEKALAILLINDVVFLNSFWWEKTWPERAKKQTSINVNCNDSFCYASADAEPLEYSEIEDLYKLWQNDKMYGPLVWCARKRNLRPLPEYFKNGGLDAYKDILGSLDPNPFEHKKS